MIKLVEKMVKLIAQHALATILIVALLASSASYIIAPRLRGPSYTVSIVAQLPSIPRAGKLFGLAEVIATAPGTKPLTKIVEIKPGLHELRVKINTYQLVQSSKKNLALAKNPTRLRLAKEEASAITILLMLYDEKGHHYLGSTIIGSYDIALARYKNPLKAYKAVEKDPYLILHAGTITIQKNKFALVNVTTLYKNIVDKYYSKPGTAKQIRNRTAISPASRLPSGCEVVTIENYKHYDLQLSSDDFIALPQLYSAQPPSSYMQHLQGLSNTEKEIIYHEFAEKFSTRVYIPATCPLSTAMYNALTEWYDHLWSQEPRLAGLLTLQELWTKIAKNAGIYLEPLHYPVWQDASIYDIKSLNNAPILRLAGVCQSGCTNNIEFEVGVSRARYDYYKNGLSIANIIFLGKERKALYLKPPQMASLTPLDMKDQVAFVLGNINIYSDADGIFIDYYVSKKALEDSRGNSHEYWVITPITAFTPLQNVNIDLDSIHAKRLHISDSEYLEYMNKYEEIIGATKAEYAWMHIDIPPSDNIIETIDETNATKEKTSIAGAVIGLSEILLNKVIASVATGGLATVLTDIAGSLISYAYNSYGISAIAIGFELETHTNFAGGHADIVKMTPYLGYPPSDLYFTSNGEQYSWYPIFVTYFVIYKGSG